MNTTNKSEEIVPLKIYCSIYKPSLTQTISFSKPLFEDIQQLHQRNYIHGYISSKNSFVLIKNGIPFKILLPKQGLFICEKTLGNMALRSANTSFPEDCAPELKYPPQSYPLISKKVDIYSCASLLYFMLAGHIYQDGFDNKYYKSKILKSYQEETNIYSEKKSAMFIDFLHSCLSFDYTYRPDTKDALKILDKIII